MKVGIIVYSQSGHTATFARTIADHLREAGIDYGIELLRPRGIPKPWTRNIEFRRIPEIDEYDIVLVGSPVWGFNASKVILKYLNSMKSLKGKKALPFVTYGLPLKSLGVNRSLKRMNAELEELCADILEGESQYYFLFKTNKNKMNEAAKRIVEKIKK